MTDSFEQFSVHLIQHYVALVRKYPAQVEAWREQTLKLERQHPEVWVGLTEKVRAELAKVEA